MEVTVSIPVKFIPVFEQNDDVSRRMLEAYAIESYRQEKMSLGQIAELLGFSIDETHAFLKEHKIPSNYDMEDLARDRRTIEMFSGEKYHPHNS
jgi:predicted HTH domain antitoxin